MRRASALLAVPLIATAAVFVAGCSSQPSNENAAVSVSGKFGAAPKVTIPAATAGKSLYTKTLIKGAGPKLSSSDSVLADYAAYDWSGKTHKLLMSSYTTHAPTLFPSDVLPGLSAALKGAKAGSRVMAVIPPKDAYGSQGNSELGVKANDTLVFVLDVVKGVSSTASASGKHVSNGGGSLATVSDPKPGQAPTITIPKGKTPPGKLTVTPLIKGSGPKVTKGQAVIVQYTGSIWRTGKTFSSSWAQKSPFEYVAGASPAEVIPGWDKGILGQTVGSRVMLTIPAADGYGKTGNSQAGIKGTDTLVFVVDVVGAVNPS